LHYGSGTGAKAASPAGRAFAHAADPSVLIGHLAQLGAGSVSQVTSSAGHTYFARLSRSADQPGSGEQAEHDKQIFAELGISEANVVLELEQAFVDLSLKANGKADLYFHAYFWQQYLTNLNELYASALDTSVPTFTEANYPFMGRLNGLSATLAKVIANIRKFPFSEKMYRKYV